MTASTSRALAVAYVAVVAGLAAVAFSDAGSRFTWQEGAAMVLALPAMVLLLPVLYVVGAAAWNLSGGAGDGGPTWPVTVVYTLAFAGIAVANVWLLRALVAVAVAVRGRWRPGGGGDDPPAHS
jgi:hypothetical protein